MKREFINYLRSGFAVAIFALSLGMVACSSEEPVTPADGDETTDEVMGLGPDEDGMLYLHYDLKVPATTFFTMDQFRHEFFSHAIWEEKTIATYKDDVWCRNFNVVEGKDGGLLKYCYEFAADGTLKAFPFPEYFERSSADTVMYEKRKYYINDQDKTITFDVDGKTLLGIDSATGEEYDTGEPAKFEHKIVAVDRGSIVLDYVRSDGTVDRTSIEPYAEEIKGVHIAFPID